MLDSMGSKRIALAGTTVGLVVGLGLGITGLANAVGGSPSPAATPPPHPNGDHRGPDGRQGFPGAPGFFGAQGFFGGSGLITALSSTSVTVDTLQGSNTVGLTSTTTYYTGKTKAALSALKVGEVVAVELVDPKATAEVAKQFTVVPAHLAGWIAKVDGSSVTVTDDSGFTRTLTTTSATTITKDGKAATPAALTVGTFITGLGAVDSDGTTLDATSITIGHPSFGGAGHPGFGDPGRAGFGGPGRGGFGGPGARPSASPSGKSS